MAQAFAYHYFSQTQHLCKKVRFLPLHHPGPPAHNAISRALHQTPRRPAKAALASIPFLHSPLLWSACLSRWLSNPAQPACLLLTNQNCSEPTVFALLARLLVIIAPLFVIIARHDRVFVVAEPEGQQSPASSRPYYRPRCALISRSASRMG